MTNSSNRMRIAVIGAGVAGLYTAFKLAHEHDVTLYEQHSRVGGHTDTHDVIGPTGRSAIDSGFIIFNPQRYPLFNAWLDELGVASRATEMSFGIACRKSGLEYNATSMNKLFCQRQNLLRPRFLRMVSDILAFYRQAPALLDSLSEQLSLGDWLAESKFSRAFADDHLIPMASALWSTPPTRVRQFPMRYLLEFMRNHNMLQANDRLVWRTIQGGSQQYVKRALARYQGRLHVSTRVERICRKADSIRVKSGAGQRGYDQVVLACHADQALAMLHEPSPKESEVLGAFEFTENDTVLHTDATRMPRNRLAWASWNVRRDQTDDSDAAQISYWMNRLQGIAPDTPKDSAPYIVSLNQTDRINPDKIIKRRRYAHPLYTHQSRTAQKQWHAINGKNGLWFCGAYWGWGFHEDAVRSADRVIRGIERRAQIDHAA
ncbi:MAG: FAD-dependent oxidoreductase [Pseudomonadota bacterium]